MAKAQTKVISKTDADADLEALRARVAAILESNGFSGMKCADEITAAVSEHLGADLPKEEEKTDAA